MDTDPHVQTSLTNPFGPPDPVVGHAPDGPVTDSPRTGRSRSPRQSLTQRLLNPRPDQLLPPGDDGGTRTSSTFSTATEPDPTPRKVGDPVVTAGIVVAGVGLVIGVSAWLLSRRGRTLRRPTNDQVRAFAKPVGALLARHTDLSWMGPDIADISTASAVITDYASEGPIAPRTEPVTHIGMDQPDPDPDPLNVAPIEYTAPSGEVTYLP